MGSASSFALLVPDTRASGRPRLSTTMPALGAGTPASQPGVRVARRAGTRPRSRRRSSPLLSLLFVAPALIPGRTLSSTDYLYSQIPWSAEAPAGLHGAVQHRAVRPGVPVHPLARVHALGAAGRRPALESAHGGGPALPGQHAVGRLLARSACRATCCRSGGRWASWPPSSCSWRASAPTCSRAGSGSRSGPGCSAGVVFGFGLYVVVHLMYPIGSVYVLIPLLLVATDAVTRRPGPWSALGLALLVALSLARRATRSRPSTRSGFALAYAVFRVAAGARDGPPRAQRGRLVRGAAASPAGRSPAVVLLPFTELLTHSADFGNREGVDIKLPSELAAGHGAARVLRHPHGRHRRLRGARRGGALHRPRPLRRGAAADARAGRRASPRCGDARGTPVAGAGRAALPARGGGALPRAHVRPARASSTPWAPCRCSARPTTRA